MHSKKKKKETISYIIQCQRYSKNADRVEKMQF